MAPVMRGLSNLASNPWLECFCCLIFDSVNAPSSCPGVASHSYGNDTSWGHAGHVLAVPDPPAACLQPALDAAADVLALFGCLAAGPRRRPGHVGQSTSGTGGARSSFGWWNLRLNSSSVGWMIEDQVGFITLCLTLPSKDRLNETRRIGNHPAQGSEMF